MHSRTINRSVKRYYRQGRVEEFLDCLVREFPVTLYFNDHELVTLLCTPEYLEDLAVGFLVSEGLMRSREELESVVADYDKGQVWVKSSAAHFIAEKTFLKRYLTTGCGKGTSFYNLNDVQSCRPITSGLHVDLGQVLDRIKDLQTNSQLFQITGGVHSAALATAEEVILYREDIGRHNAVDKILGYCLRQGQELAERIMLTSGRLSSEMLLKVAKAGIPMVVSRSAPTDLAVELADQLGITLAGFARGPRFNVYSHPERIVGLRDGGIGTET
ncbi:MAG: formate dehydrogenase accessory sulfurtransferase FdhD [Bacillota bacterium]|jgi:FdhD protein